VRAESSSHRETVKGHIALNPGAARAADERSDSSIDDAKLPLTARELEILRLVASGSSNAGGVARQLWITEQTVKFHLRNIYRKLDVANRTEASHFAHINGLVSRGFEAKPELPVAS
jgi:DNA-binding NarL/FixJ family response regulator